MTSSTKRPADYLHRCLPRFHLRLHRATIWGVMFGSIFSLLRPQLRRIRCRLSSSRSRPIQRTRKRNPMTIPMTKISMIHKPQLQDLGNLHKLKMIPITTKATRRIVPTQARTSSQRTDSSETIDYSDLFVDDSQWSWLTQEQKLCSNTGSFTVPRYIDGTPVNVKTVSSHADFVTSYSVIAERKQIQSKKNFSDLTEVYSGITEEDKAYLTFFSIIRRQICSSRRQEAQRSNAARATPAC